MKSVLKLALLATASSRLLVSEVWIPATNEGPITDCSGTATIVVATSESLLGTSFCDTFTPTACTTVGDWSSRVYCADSVPDSTGQGFRTATWIDSTTECDGPPTSVAYFGKTGCFPLVPSGVTSLNLTDLFDIPIFFKVSCSSAGSCNDNRCTDCIATYPIVSTECIGGGGAYTSITCGGATQYYEITFEVSGSVDANELEQYLQSGLQDWGIFGTVTVTEGSDGSYSVTISNTNADEASVKRAVETTPGVSRVEVTAVGAGASVLSLFW